MVFVEAYILVSLTKSSENDMASNKKWLQTAVNPKRAGMFDNVSSDEIRRKLAALKRQGPHSIHSVAMRKMREYEFALRARAKGGFHSN
ncbi:MAG: hypothetical protein ACREQ5_29945 [Candidatus Dormibacteria bacterium]